MPPHTMSARDPSVECGLTSTHLSTSVVSWVGMDEMRLDNHLELDRSHGYLEGHSVLLEFVGSVEPKPGLSRASVALISVSVFSTYCEPHCEAFTCTFIHLRILVGEREVRESEPVDLVYRSLRRAGLRELRARSSRSSGHHGSVSRDARAMDRSCDSRIRSSFGL
ncbi:hypothetical protein CRG98_043533 [Punica granatum]|uniref:Uncharacterized protein n=1 Tax=Punica granatum TaxID=22663 RepID=A0A2I0HWJ6_PUNGR|nr:hypothetical protein CRG98_043533 [Punica granatum]